MADFNKSIPHVLSNEGGYSNNPDDHGGETYAGIARKFWPEWGGWRIVDRYKFQNIPPFQLNEKLKNDFDLQNAVASFYKTNFWDVLKLDSINDQQIANTVMDFAVNSGVTHSAKFLQQACTQSGTALTVDGVIGEQTIQAVNDNPADAIYNAFNGIRKEFYEELAQKPGQAQFLHSWLSRLTPYV